MASKNAHHSEVSDQLLTDLGFEEAVEVGIMMKNIDIEEIYLSESLTQYDKIKDLLEIETTANLTTVKRAFILPMHNVSTDRLKAALKEHKISMRYNKISFLIIISNTNLMFLKCCFKSIS